MKAICETRIKESLKHIHIKRCKIDKEEVESKLELKGLDDSF